MKLVIVESPAKCQKIQGFLGSGWRVIASMGHIRALEEDLDAIGLNRDFEPNFTFMKEKAKAMAQLKEAAKDVTEVYLAADDDREGEAIAYSVALLLKLPVATTPRAVFHEITEKAVKEAVANPRRIDMNRVNAQQARAVLDMMVGYTISPLLWKHIAHALSAGRCQTPALRLVCEKEQEIRSFKSSVTWKLKGSWSHKTISFQANLVDDLEDEESALNYLENLHSDMEATVHSAITRPWTESPPKPLITSTLQQEASALYNINPKSAMQAAQRLYEAGHITYMRTDKAVLSDEAINAAQAWIRSNLGLDYIGAPQETVAPKQSKGKGKKEEGPKAQEAHEAIRPTHFEIRELPADEDWSGMDRKIYTLIWNRAVQSTMAVARGELRKILFKAKGDPCEFDWQSQWRRTIFLGWKKLGATANLDDEENEQDSQDAIWKEASSIKEGSVISWTSLEALPYQSRASPRFTEATLVRELEKKGIGRPSTFAMLLASIQDKKYVEKQNIPVQKVQRTRYSLTPGQWPPTGVSFDQQIGGEKDKLVPTSLGERVLQFCVEKFADLFDYGFTASMETRLDKIADGQEQWKQVLRDTWASYKDRYETLKKTDADMSSRSKEFPGGIKAVQSKKGPLLLIESADGKKEKTKFLGWPQGVSWDDLTEQIAVQFAEQKQRENPEEIMGNLDGKPVEKKKGPFGSYVVWGTVKLSIKGTETFEEVEKALREKESAVIHSLGPFEFRKSQYGVYMFKKDIKQKRFVGLPEGLDPKTLTQESAVKLYQEGLQQKSRGGKFVSQRTNSTTTPTQQPSTRGRGGFRGRGRGRGRGK